MVFGQCLECVILPGGLREPYQPSVGVGQVFERSGGVSGVETEGDCHIVRLTHHLVNQREFLCREAVEGVEKDVRTLKEAVFTENFRGAVKVAGSVVRGLRDKAREVGENEREVVYLSTETLCTRGWVVLRRERGG